MDAIRGGTRHLEGVCGDCGGNGGEGVYVRCLCVCLCVRGGGMDSDGIAVCVAAAGGGAEERCGAAFSVSLRRVCPERGMAFEWLCAVLRERRTRQRGERDLLWRSSLSCPVVGSA